MLFVQKSCSSKFHIYLRAFQPISHDSWLFFILQDFGGSAKVAKELYNMLQPKNADFVSEEELKECLDHALKLYLKKKDDDKSGLKSTQNFLD